MLNADAVELSFFKKDNSSYFVVNHIPENTAVKISGNYFISFFADKKAKDEIFKYNIKDNIFAGFFIENLDNGSRIIIQTKRRYKPVYTTYNNSITIRAVIKKTINKISGADNIKRIIPTKLIAVPFYVSEKVFMKNNIQKELSYDETLFFTGVKMFANENYTAAMQFFKEIVTKYPQSSFYVSSYFLLGDCYRNTKKYQKAISVYKKAIKISPKNDMVAQTLFNMADMYIKMKYYSQTRGIYKSVIKDYSGTKWGDKAQYMLAKTYYDENRLKKSLNLLLNINKNSSYYSLSMLIAAEIFIKEGNDVKAVLAYYSMSDKLSSIDVYQYCKELIDTADALCRFNDYKGADGIFNYTETFKNNSIIEKSYIGRMRCDLYKGDYTDLKNRGSYIISTSKNKDRVQEADKLLDEAKLKKGNVDKNTINKILNKYADDPDVAALALYVYARKNHRDKNYAETLNYLLKLKKFYPSSVYNKKAYLIAKDSVNNIINDFYLHPDKHKLDFAYDASVHLNVYKADMCRLTLALSVLDEIDKMQKVLPYINDKNCKESLYAKYYIEKGEDKKALEFIGDIQKIKPYVYYIDMAVGDVNYFKGAYTKAVEFYEKALGIDNRLLRAYISLKISNTMYLSGQYSQSIRYLRSVKLKVYQNKVIYIKAMDLYGMGEYKRCIAVFEELTGDLNYQERALFYTAISYSRISDNKNAEKYFNKLKNSYPNSRYIKTLKAVLQ